MNQKNFIWFSSLPLAMPQCPVNNQEDQDRTQASSSQFFGTVSSDQGANKFVHVAYFN